MKFLKKIVKSFILVGLIVLNSNAFEQNGVKDGNIKISGSLVSTQPKSGLNKMDLYFEVGDFYNDNIEVLIGLQLEVQEMQKNNELFYTLSPGVNYYFYKTPLITPYIGGQFFYKNTSYEYVRETKGSKFYIGTHVFITENIAMTPEFGTIYKDFDIEKGTYFNTFFTYFF